VSEEDDEPAEHAASGPGSRYPEPDPEADLPDPESDLPSVPAVDVPEPPRPSGEPSPELRKAFWTTVLVLNVGLLATSVGAMMLAFGVERRLGAGLLAVGLLSLVRGYRKYRRLDERHRSGALTGSDGDAGGEGERNG